MPKEVRLETVERFLQVCGEHAKRFNPLLAAGALGGAGVAAFVTIRNQTSDIHGGAVVG